MQALVGIIDEVSVEETLCFHFKARSAMYYTPFWFYGFIVYGLVFYAYSLVVEYFC